LPTKELECIYIILFNHDLEIVEIGSPFFFEHIGIEIAAGMVLHEAGVLFLMRLGIDSAVY
jgi:hypothetical protein